MRTVSLLAAIAVGLLHCGGGDGSQVPPQAPATPPPPTPSPMPTAYSGGATLEGGGDPNITIGPVRIALPPAPEICKDKDPGGLGPGIVAYQMTLGPLLCGFFHVKLDAVPISVICTNHGDDLLQAEFTTSPSLPATSIVLKKGETSPTGAKIARSNLAAASLGIDHFLIEASIVIGKAPPMKYKISLDRSTPDCSPP